MNCGFLAFLRCPSELRVGEHQGVLRGDNSTGSYANVVASKKHRAR